MLFLHFLKKRVQNISLNEQILNISDDIIINGDNMNDSTVGAMMFVLGVVLAILALAIPGLFYWLFWIIVIILIIYGLYQWLIRK